jgi:hypothetical protein
MGEGEEDRRKEEDEGRGKEKGDTCCTNCSSLAPAEKLTVGEAPGFLFKSF